MGLCEKTYSTFDRCIWMWRREWIQAGKYSSEYYIGKFPQPSKSGQYSSPGNTEKITKIFQKKSNPKAHNHQIHQGWSEGENAKGSQRERSGHPQRGSPSDSQQITRQKHYKPEESGSQYSTSLKKRTFNTEFHIQPNWASEVKEKENPLQTSKYSEILSPPGLLYKSS